MAEAHTVTARRACINISACIIKYAVCLFIIEKHDLGSQQQHDTFSSVLKMLFRLRDKVSINSSLRTPRAYQSIFLEALFTRISAELTAHSIDQSYAESFRQQFMRLQYGCPLLYPCLQLMAIFGTLNLSLSHPRNALAINLKPVKIEGDQTVFGDYSNLTHSITLYAINSGATSESGSLAYLEECEPDKHDALSISLLHELVHMLEHAMGKTYRSSAVYQKICEISLQTDIVRLLEYSPYHTSEYPREYLARIIEAFYPFDREASYSPNLSLSDATQYELIVETLTLFSELCTSVMTQMIQRFGLAFIIPELATFTPNKICPHISPLSQDTWMNICRSGEFPLTYHIRSKKPGDYFSLFLAEQPQLNIPEYFHQTLVAIVAHPQNQYLLFLLLLNTEHLGLPESDFFHFKSHQCWAFYRNESAVYQRLVNKATVVIKRHPGYFPEIGDQPLIECLRELPETNPSRHLRSFIDGVFAAANVDEPSSLCAMP